MTITTTAPVIDATGIHVPSYADVLAYLQAKYQGIYGSDVYLGNDSQDGQFIGIITQAITDANSATLLVYNSFSPATAQKAALSSNVKINGIARESSSYSNVDLTIIGQVGTTITNGVAADSNGNKWALPASVVIPSAGVVVVTATCSTLGAVAAQAGSVNQISTPTLGWQSVKNISAANAGAPIESDAALRQRQATSTAIPSRTVLDGTVGAVANLPGVTRYAAYENDTGAVDANGLPAHTISLVVEGGDATAIAGVIALKKTPGTGTYGTTAVNVVNNYGRSITIRLFRPTEVTITAAVAMKALAGYSSATGAAVQQALVDYINATAIGGGLAGGVEWDAAIAAAKSVPNSNTFKIASLVLSGPAGAGAPDVPLLFNQAGQATLAGIVLTVT